MSTPDASTVPITVVLADDSEVMRDAIRQLLEVDARILVVGEVKNFVELVAAATNLRPRVLVVDIHMAGRREIPADFFSTRLAGCTVLAISLWNDPETLKLADSIGAVKLLSKSAMSTELVPTVLQLAQRTS
jgi:DNA-binding NarL/FixJ family response regulator